MKYRKCDRCGCDIDLNQHRSIQIMAGPGREYDLCPPCMRVFEYGFLANELVEPAVHS